MELLIDDHLKFSDEHKKLLTAQVLLTDTQQRTQEQLQKLEEAQQRTQEQLRELKEALQRTDERLDALIAVIDGFIRRNPPSPQ